MRLRKIELDKNKKAEEQETTEDGIKLNHNHNKYKWI